VLVQAGVFFAVNDANLRNARRVIDDALIVAASVFNRQIAERQRELRLAARLLSGDFAFKQAYATREHATVLSALENHRLRIGADVMLVLSLEGTVIADTLHPARTAARNPFPPLLAAAANNRYGEAAGIVFLDGQSFQMVIVPLLIPVADAWIGVGFRIGDDFAHGLQQDIHSHVSLLRADAGGWVPFASTLPDAQRHELARRLGEAFWRKGESHAFELGAETYVSLVTPLLEKENLTVVAVLQRSLGEALRPYLRLQAVLIGLFAFGAVLSVIGAVWVARTVTRPVLKLAAGARRIEEGEYTQRVEIDQQDEIGALASAFNHMGKGLAERDRVRNLLGKVVSPAIAEELLSKKIELGGEEREVSVLFSDLRDFTALCESRTPQEILALLNRYLTEVSAVVEAHGGVVDKYVGDAMMALYGAPLHHEDDAARAVGTALGMCAALERLNADFAAAGRPQLRIGVGINTATVVAGNMGSSTRMNYTVIGDGVNLASRLEGLSKHYGVTVVVSETTTAAAPDFIYRELDHVCVKGKKEAVTIHEPLGRRGEVDARQLEQLARYVSARAAFLGRRWKNARAGFGELLSASPERLYRVYLERIEAFRRAPPAADWDGSFVHTGK
jgi:adenylate cyclase